MWCGESLSGVAVPEMVLICPTCNIRLDKKVGEGWEVHLCEECKGLWMSQSIFRRLEDLQRKQAKLDEAEQSEEPEVVGEDSTEGKVRGDEMVYRKCPQCREMMARRRYARVSDVIVDQCVGHGVWLDAGEFQRVVRFLRTGGRQHRLPQVSMRFNEKIESPRLSYDPDLDAFLGFLSRHITYPFII